VFYLHCGLIRGVLLGQLLRQSLNQIYVNATDGFYARVFFKVRPAALLAGQFHSLQITVVRAKGRTVSDPRNSLKIALERVTPDWFGKSNPREIRIDGSGGSDHS